MSAPSRRPRHPEEGGGAPFPAGASVPRAGVFLLLLALTAFVAYLPSLSGPFMLDDIHNIVQNSAVRLNRLDLASIGKLLDLPDTVDQRRVTAYGTFALNYYFGGYDPLGYRLFNLAVLLLSIPFAAWLAWLLADTWHKGPASAAIALGTAAVWTLHPVLTNGTAYIVQRMTSLCVLFCLISLCCFLTGVRTGRRAWHVGSLAAWILALTTKEIAILLPLPGLLYLFMVSPPGTALRRRLALLLTAALLFSQGALLWIYGGHASWQIRPFTLQERLLTQGRVVLHYLTLFLAPFPRRLNLDYEYPLSTSLWTPISTLPAILFHVLLVLLAIRLQGRRPLFSFGILSFYLLQLLESTVLPLEIIFEHRLYFPSFFLALLCGDLLYGALGRIAPARAAKLTLAGAVIFGGALAGWTYQRASLWADPVVLLQDVVSKSPGKARPRHNLGVILTERGRYREALPHLETARRLAPRNAEILNTMGNTLMGLERTGEAKERFSLALAMAPGYAEAHNNLGTLLDLQGEPAEALRHFDEAIRLNPDYAKALYNRGTLLARRGDLAEAETSYGRAIALDPRFAPAHFNLGVALARQGRLDAAEEHFRETIRIDGDHGGAHYNLGVALARGGRTAEAEASFREALRIDPRYGEGGPGPEEPGPLRDP
jgi:tetratricopeptide (TPR) repeat protein